MATVLKDFEGKRFINVDQRVGPRAPGFPNRPNDVLVVQAMLANVYNEDSVFRSIRPTKGPAVVSSTLQKDTPTLIAHFQRVVLKRPKPQGFINHATRTDQQLVFSTIWRLFRTAETTILLNGFGRP